MSQTLVDLAPLALTQDVELSFDNHIGEARITADHEAIKEILRNLVDNALKYGQPLTGQAHINVSLEPTPDKAWVVLQVQDFGLGVAPELLKQVTQRFGRGELNQQSGSGLGLAIVEQLVHGMQGRLELANAPAGGLLARVLLKVSL